MFKNSKFRPQLKIDRQLVFFVILLIAIQIGNVFLYHVSGAEFYELVGLNPNTFLEGKMWTILSYSLFHHPEQWSHFILNILALIYFSARISHIFSATISLRILGTGILVGGILHLLIDPITRTEPVTLIGISGGVCAIFAALATFAPDSIFWPLYIRGRHLLTSFITVSVFFLLISPALGIPYLSSIGEEASKFSGVAIFKIGHACHLGGLISGFLYAKYLIRIPRIKTMGRPTEN